jgi:hypothetical protein
MNERNKPGSGIVGKNRHFDAARRTPHMVGHLFAHRDLKAGERIELSMWEFKTRPGEGYTIQAKDPRSLSQEAGLTQAAGKATAAPSDDIPF